MACPCCATQTPCDPCYECEWPEDQTETLLNEENECSFGLYRGRSKAFQRYPNPSIFGTTNVVFKEGVSFPSTCNWTFVTDFAFRECCCDIAPEFGGKKGIINYKWRIRLLLVQDCPEGGQATVVDVTEQFLDVEQSWLEDDWYSPTDTFPPCLADVTCVDEIPPFYPDPDPWVTCNPLP